MSKCPLTGKPCDCPKLFQLTECSNNEVREYQVCADCLVEKPEMLPKAVPDILQKFFEVFSFIFGGFSQYMIQQLKTEDTCPKCGIKLREILETNQVGCAKCYSYFGKEIGNIVQSAQEGATEHVEEIPVTSFNCNPMWVQAALDDKIKFFIKEEKYELAGEAKQAINKLNAMMEQYQNDPSPEIAQEMSHFANSILQQGILDQ